MKIVRMHRIHYIEKGHRSVAFFRIILQITYEVYIGECSRYVGSIILHAMAREQGSANKVFRICRKIYQAATCFLQPGIYLLY